MVLVSLALVGWLGTLGTGGGGIPPGHDQLRHTFAFDAVAPTWAACQATSNGTGLPADVNAWSQQLAACRTYLQNTPPGNVLAEAGLVHVAADPSGPYTGAPGALIPISGSAALRNGTTPIAELPAGTFTCSWSATGAVFSPDNVSCATNVTFAEAGPSNLSLTVNYAATSFDRRNTTVTITAPPPSFQPIGGQSVAEGGRLTFDIAATPSGAVVAYNGTLPAGATFVPNGTTHAFDWQPGFLAAGAYTLRFNATANGQVADLAVPVQVSDTNRAPSIVVADANGTFPGMQWNVTEGERLNFTVFAVDLDADDTANLTINWTALPPAGLGPPASQNASGSVAQFDWTPPRDTVGTFYANVTVQDTKAQASRNFSIGVAAVAPSVSLPGGESALVNENHSLVVNISVQPDVGLVLNRSLADFPNQPGLGLPLNATLVRTGANWTFAWRPNLTANGTYDLGFSVTRHGQTAQANLTITVADLQSPPTLALLTAGNSPAPDAMALREREWLNLTAVATDPDGDAVTLAILTDVPGGASLLDGNGSFSWRPSWGETGLRFANFTATSGSEMAWRNVTLEVSPASPVLSLPVGPIHGLEGALLTVAIGVEPDVPVLMNGSNLAFRNLNGTNATMDTSVGQATFRWTPNHTANGTYTLRFNATRLGQIAEGAINITIATTNQAPALALADATSVDVPPGSTLAASEDEPLRLLLNATDADGDPLQFAVSSSLPSQAYELNATQGTLDVRVPFGHAGNHSLNVSASDGLAVAFANITLDVARSAPAIEAPARVLGIENDLLRFNVSVRPDVPLVVNGSLAAFRDHKGGTAQFQQTGANWTFAWTPDSASNGTHLLRLNATRFGLVRDVSVAVDVAEANQAPGLRLQNATFEPYAANVTHLVENSAARVHINATDEDGDPLVLSLTTDLPGSAYTFNATARTIDLHPAYGHVGTYFARAQADDGNDTAAQNLTVIILPDAPRITAPMMHNGSEEVPLAIPLSVVPDVPITFNGTPPGNHTSGNASLARSGANWTFVWTPNSTANGTYVLRFEAARLGRVATANVTVSIANVNHPPSITLSNRTAALPAGSVINVTEGTLVDLAIAASDIDIGDRIHILAAAIPPDAAFSAATSVFGDAATGTFSWRPSAGSAGLHAAIFAVGDQTTYVYHNLTINVTTPPPPPPTIQAPTVVQGTEGVPLTFTASVQPSHPLSLLGAANLRNLDGSNVTFSQQGSLWAFTWTPNFTANGTHVLTLATPDATAQRLVTVHVADSNRPPAILVTRQGIDSASIQIKPLERLSLLVVARDEDRQSLTLERSTNLPLASVLTDLQPSETGTETIFRFVDWTPSALQAGQYYLNLTARDATSAVWRNVTLAVQAPATTLDDLEGGMVREVPAAVVSSLRAVLGVNGAFEPVNLIDADADGRYDEVIDSAGRLETVHAAKASQSFLMRDRTTGGLAIYHRISGIVEPVATIANVGVQASGGSGGDPLSLEVTLPGKTGWIQIIFADSRPEWTLAEVRRADGSLVPAEFVWRADGLVYILDDPAVTYHVELLPPSDDGDGGSRMPAWLAYSTLAVACTAVAALVAWRRWRAQPRAEDPGPDMDTFGGEG